MLMYFLVRLHQIGVQRTEALGIGALGVQQAQRHGADCVNPLGDLVNDNVQIIQIFS